MLLGGGFDFLLQRAADHAEDLDGAQGGAGDKETLGIAKGFGRNNREPRGFDLEKIIGQDPLGYISIPVFEPHPKAFHFGTGLKDLAAGLGGGFEVPNESQGFDVAERDEDDIALGRKQLDSSKLQKTQGIDVSREGFFVESAEDRLFGRGAAHGYRGRPGRPDAGNRINWSGRNINET